MTSPSAKQYLRTMATVSADGVGSVHKTMVLIIVTLITIASLAMWLTPWIQTAYGQGEVASLNPLERPQAISVLVPGQISQWHVMEGAEVKAGDPIVTLTDIDRQRLERLKGQLAATQAMLAADQSAVTNAQSNLKRQQALLKEGVVSAKTVEAAQIKLQSLMAKAAKSSAEVDSARMALSRQSTLTKYAPADGVVTQLLAGGQATYVSAGQPIAKFIPTDFKRAVRIAVSGLDAPLVFPGAKARLQFEGWPAFQFSGWPGTSVGTFAGKVAYVEPLANGNGQFSVWIVPEDDASWPDSRAVRLGSRAKAWVLLEEVALGYELWRQLNNFPPQNPNAGNSGGNYAN